MWVEIFYKVKYKPHLGESREVIISAPFDVVRIKEILSEVNPSWEIQDIIPIRGIQ